MNVSDSAKAVAASLVIFFLSIQPAVSQDTDPPELRHFSFDPGEIINANWDPFDKEWDLTHEEILFTIRAYDGDSGFTSATMVIRNLATSTERTISFSKDNPGPGLITIEKAITFDNPDWAGRWRVSSIEMCDNQGNCHELQESDLAGYNTQFIVDKDSDGDDILDRYEREGYEYDKDEGVIIPSPDGIRTNPDMLSSDGNPLSDYMEVTGRDTDTSILPPYNDPLVAARPNILLDIVSYKITPKGEIKDSEENAYTEQDSWSHDVSASMEVGASITVSAEAGFPSGGKASVSATAHWSVTTGYGNTWGGLSSATSKWSQATTTQIGDVADLQLTYILRNEGSATARNVQCTFTVYLGDEPLGTQKTQEISILNSYGGNSGERTDMDPSYPPEISLSLEEFKKVRMGFPMRFVVVEIEAKTQRWDGTGWVYDYDWAGYETQIEANCMKVYAIFDNGLGIENRYGQEYDIAANILGRSLKDTLNTPGSTLVEGDVGSFTFNGYRYPDEVLFFRPDFLDENGDPTGINDTLRNLMIEQGMNPEEEIGDSIFNLDLCTQDSGSSAGSQVLILACKNPYVTILDYVFTDDGKARLILETSTYLVDVEADVQYQDGSIDPEPIKLTPAGSELYRGEARSLYEGNFDAYDPDRGYPRLWEVRVTDIYRNDIPPIPGPPPRTIYVATTGSDFTGDGSSGNPYRTIQKGIDEAHHHCWDVVEVMDGTYTGGGNVNLDFKGKAITVRSMNGPGNCFIDCEGILDTRGFDFHNNETEYSVLEGFTIKNGRGRIYEGYYYCGGGILCHDSSPSITNCTITGNKADYDGGGIWCYRSSPTITNCTITGNRADDQGGGIYCLSSSSTTIANCTITGNSAYFEAGGISCSDSYLSVTNTILWNNSTSIYVTGNSPDVSYSDIEGGWSGIGNIDSDPLFVNAAGGDYHLAQGSPCIDRGTSAGAPERDIEYRPRVRVRPAGDPDYVSDYDMGLMNARTMLPLPYMFQ